MQQYFPDLLECAMTDPDTVEWPRYGFNVNCYRDSHDSLIPDAHEDDSHNVDEIDGDEAEVVVPDAARISVPAQPAMTPTPRGKLFVMLKIWSLIFRIPSSAMAILLSIIAIFTRLLSDEIRDEEIALTVYNMNAYIGTLPTDDDLYFDTYSWCQLCSSIYTPSQVRINDTLLTRKCSHVRFPHHPQRQYRNVCGGDLGRYVKQNGTSVYKPLVPYYYRPLLSRLSELFMRDDFVPLVNH